MPRQRKPQNGGTRLGTGRVANTTTSQAKLQTVYRIPAGRDYGGCEKLAYEVVGTSPIRVNIEGENVYRISLDEAALKQVIESYPELNLSNVTLETVNGDVTFAGNVTVDGSFTGTTMTADSLQATTIDADDITANGSISSSSVSTSDLTTTTLQADSGDISTLNSSDITASSIQTSDINVDNSATIGGNVDVTGTVTAEDITANTSITTGTITAETGNITTVNSTNTYTGVLDVTGPSTFTGDVSTNNISSSGAANLSVVTIDSALYSEGSATLNTLTVNGATTLTGNASVGGNLSVTGNETITGNMTLTGDGVFSNDVSVARNLTVSGDATVTDDLTVNGSTHLKTLETTGSASIAGNLSVDGSIAGGSSLVVENQIESGSVVTTNTVTDNLTVNGNIALGNDATAPDFVLQSEKGQPNGVCPLDANGKVDPQYLPPVYTTAIVKMGTGVFSNSDTSVVVDADITADSFVAISNYSDIIGDLNEVINVGQLTVVSNQTETGSYKYIIVNPIS